MSDRLRRWGEYLLMAIVPGFLFMGALGVGRAAHHPVRMTDAGYVHSEPGMGIAASVISGRHRKAGRMTAEWSVCWSGAETTCFDVGLEWRAQIRGDE